ncbi:MAG TPA: DUF5610 domain-containing protein [Burkholderiaceae bacterium]
MPAAISGSTATPIDGGYAPAAKADTENKTAKAPTRETARSQLNGQIIQATLAAANDPQALLLKSAINGINDLLAPELGKDALQSVMGQDNSPAGTSGRIVSISTGFFELYKKQHPGEDEEQVLKQFMQTIRGGNDRGFSEARNILQGMKVLGGDIAGNIDKTYALVQQGYADFESAQLARIKESKQQGAQATVS